MFQLGSFSPPAGWRRPDVILTSLCINLLALALPILILQVYDRIIPNASLSTMGFLIFGVSMAIVLEVSLRIVRAGIINQIGARFEHRTSLEAFDRILRSDMSAYENESPAAYLENMKGISSIRDFYLGQVALLLVDLPFVLIFLALIWFIAGPLVVIPLVLLTGLVFVSTWIGMKLKTALEQRVETDKRRYDFLIELLGGIHTVKSMAMEFVMLRRYERLQGKSAETICELSRLNAIGQSVSSAFSQATIVCVVGLGCLLVVNQTMTMGGLAACTMLAGRVLQPILKTIGIWNKFQSIQLAEERFAKLANLTLEQEGVREEIDLERGSIELKDVTFRYGDGQEPLFENLSLKVNPGEMIGITGDNSCGKSTLLHIITGIVKPESGRILIDDRDITAYDTSYLRSQMGLIPQIGDLFNGTLIENLSMFQDGPHRERALEISEKIQLTNFVARLPNGLDTKVGEGSINNFPKGVQQRIVFARALNNDPKIVLFDNANTGMDMQSDKDVSEALCEMKGKKTLIVVSHRPSLLAKCDAVYAIRHKGLRKVKLKSAPPPQAATSLRKPDPTATPKLGKTA